MKDIHCHLLPGIDDGAKDFKESVILLRKAQREGITDIVLTPHYIKNTKYNCDNEKKEKIFEKLKLYAKTNNININLYLGNEVFLDEEVISLIKKKKIKTINNTKYILVEFPLEYIMKNAKDILYDLITNDYIPILAHPERYHIFKQHPEYVLEFLRMGVLLQGNYLSLLGAYGKEAKKALKFFLKNNWISFLASDMHHDGNYDISKMKKKLKRIVHNDIIVDDLLMNNFEKVINNYDIGIKG